MGLRAQSAFHLTLVALASAFAFSLLLAASASAMPVVNVLTPDGTTFSNRAPSFEFTVEGDGAVSVSCSLHSLVGAGGVEATDCASPADFHVANGPYMFILTATDESGDMASTMHTAFVDLPADFRTTPACPSVKVIGLRGSGEPFEDPSPIPGYDGLGTPVKGFVKTLESEVGRQLNRLGQSSTVAYQGVPYLAIDVGPPAFLNVDAWIRSRTWEGGFYRESVENGITLLKSTLDLQASSACANRTTIVLAGYSQGAQVIGDYLDRHGVPPNLNTKLRTVVFFGDPRFNAEAERVVNPRELSTAITSRKGALTARPKDAFTGLSSKFRVFSYCRNLDPICQNYTGLGFAGPHERYHEAEAHSAAYSVGQRFFPRGVLLGDTSITADLHGNQLKMHCQTKAYGVCVIRADVVVGLSIIGATGPHRNSYIGRAGRSGRVDFNWDLPRIGNVVSVDGVVKAWGISPGRKTISSKAFL